MPHFSSLLHNRVNVARKYILLTSGEEAKQRQENNSVNKKGGFEEDIPTDMGYNLHPQLSAIL